MSQIPCKQSIRIEKSGWFKHYFPGNLRRNFLFKVCNYTSYQNSFLVTNFFFVNHHGRPTCLICNVSIAVNKEYNIKRHYETKHKSFSELVGQARKDKLDRLKKV